MPKDGLGNRDEPPLCTYFWFYLGVAMPVPISLLILTLFYDAIKSPLDAVLSLIPASLLYLGFAGEMVQVWNRALLTSIRSRCSKQPWTLAPLGFVMSVLSIAAFAGMLILMFPTFVQSFANGSFLGFVIASGLCIASYLLASRLVLLLFKYLAILVGQAVPDDLL